MKKIFFTISSILLALGASAQQGGSVFFYNHVFSLSTHVYDFDFNRGPFLFTTSIFGNSTIDTPAGTTVYNSALLSGSGWTAQLWAATGAGAAESSLIGIPANNGGTSTFRTGAAAGYWGPTTANLIAAGVPKDAEAATLQVRVFPTSYGSWSATLAAAFNGDSNARYGRSLLFTVNHLGGDFNTPAYLTGLQSFSLGQIPEPSSVSILLLAVAFSRCSRNKHIKR